MKTRYVLNNSEAVFTMIQHVTVTNGSELEQFHPLFFLVFILFFVQPCGREACHLLHKHNVTRREKRRHLARTVASFTFFLINRKLSQHDVLVTAVLGAFREE